MYVCVIDVGSHTVRLLLASRENGQVNALREEKAALALGVEIERVGRISDTKLVQTADLVRAFVRIARKAGAERIETLVTAPGRQSANGTELLRLLLEASGGAVRVLSPDEEGRLAFSGAIHGTATTGESVAVCDVGGGSTEVVVGSRTGEPAWVRSVEIGAVRLTSRTLPEDPPSAEALSRARLEVEREFESFTPPLPKSALAAGGTARALRKLVGDTLGAGELDEALDILARRRSSRIAKTFGIDRERARTLAAGAVILTAVQRRLGIPLQVSRTGLREGAVLAMLDETAEAA
jgi:exopolyphosphatase / guanosine-5'-triphosphate,3'-diphosphate pyrophosphatase